MKKERLLELAGIITEMDKDDQYERSENDDLKKALEHLEFVLGPHMGTSDTQMNANIAAARDILKKHLEYRHFSEAELVGNVDHKPDKYDLGGAINLKVHHNKDNTEVVLTGKGGSIFLTTEEWQDVVDSITGQGLRDLQ